MPPRRRQPLPEPTIDYILACYQGKIAEKPESRLRTIAYQCRLLTEMSHKIDIPEEYRRTTKEIRTPFFRDAWLRIAAALTRNDWLLHINPLVADEAATQRATSLAERWVKSATAAMDRETNETVFYEAGKALVRDGESVIKIIPRADAWANFPNYRARRNKEPVYNSPEAYMQAVSDFKRSSPFPMAWRVIDRLQMVFGDGEFGDEWAIEFGEYPMPVLARKYGLIGGFNQMPQVLPEGPENDDEKITPANTLGGRPYPEGYGVTGTGGVVQKIEYWDYDWYAVVINNQFAPGFPTKNPIGCLPYVRGRSDSDPEPVLYGLLYLVPALDAMLTAWTNWAWLGAFPNPMLRDVPNSNNLPQGLDFAAPGQPAQPTTFTWSPGKMLNLPRGKEFEFMQAPPIGSDLKDLVVLLQQFISIAGVPNMMRGISLSGDSGYLASQMMEAAELTYKRLGSAQERQMARATQLMFDIVANNIKEAVFVKGPTDNGNRYIGLSPKAEDLGPEVYGLSELGSVEVTVRPDLSAVQQARAMIARQLVDGPVQTRLDSRRHAMEYWMGFEDPDSIIDEIYVEEAIATDPDLRALVVQEAKRRAGITAPVVGAVPGPGSLGGAGPKPAGMPGQVEGGLPNQDATLGPNPNTPPLAGVAAGAGMYPGGPPNPVPMAPGGVA